MTRNSRSPSRGGCGKRCCTSPRRSSGTPDGSPSGWTRPGPGPICWLPPTTGYPAGNPRPPDRPSPDTDHGPSPPPARSRPKPSRTRRPPLAPRRNPLAQTRPRATHTTRISYCKIGANQNRQPWKAAGCGLSSTGLRFLTQDTTLAPRPRAKLQHLEWTYCAAVDHSGEGLNHPVFTQSGPGRQVSLTGRFASVELLPPALPWIGSSTTASRRSCIFGSLHLAALGAVGGRERT
jgi:hypothetical protein